MAKEENAPAHHEAGACDAEVALSLAEVEPSPGVIEPLVGECIETRHPTLAGRILVRWNAGKTIERWLPVLQGLAVRMGDRVLLLKPGNWPEAVVTGVLDGFARRPEPRRTSAAEIALLPDETLRVTAADGTPLVDVCASQAGPVVRLAAPDVVLELPGALRVSARAIELRAREDAVEVAAASDVIVNGETIQLN